MTAKIEDIAEMRITRIYTYTLWERVWKNLHAAVVPDSVKSTWHLAIHDIFPTKERLAAIGLTDTSSCVHCGHIDTLQHRVVECGERPVIWHWTRERIVAILRMDTRRIPVEWNLRPDFQLCSPQKQAAVIWILAHFIAYSLQSTKRLSLLDYMDFLRRARWRLYNGPWRSKPGKYLDVL